MTDDLGRLAAALETSAFGRAHEHHDTIGSTSDRAADWARHGAPHGAVVTADSQTAGRGRRGRRWESPPSGHLYASVVIRPDDAGPGFGALGLAVAVALREALPVADDVVRLKWPNDLLVEDRKMAGILCEARWQGRAPEIVVGFGVNVRRWSPSPELHDIVTSLEEAGATNLSRVRLLADILASLERTLEVFFAGGFEAIRARYEPYSSVLGQSVELEDPARPGHRRRVVAEALDRDGALLVRPAAGGPTQRVETADVWLTAQ